MLEQIRRLWRTWIDGRGVALLGIVAGVAGFMLARQYLVNADRSIATKYEQAYAPRRVIVAAAALQAGESLSPAQLAVRSMPQRYLPSGAVSAEAVGSVLDAKLRVAMKPGDPLERSMLHVAPPSIATRLPPGSRGLTLGCETLGAAGGLLRTGDRVDVWLADDAASARRSERPDVVGDVMVVAASVDAAALDERSDPSGSCSLTLQVSTAQAGQLLAAAASGGLAAVLRPTQEPPLAQLLPQVPVVVPQQLGRRFMRGLSVEFLSADGHRLSRQWLAAEMSP